MLAAFSSAAAAAFAENAAPVIPTLLANAKSVKSSGILYRVFDNTSLEYVANVNISVAAPNNVRVDISSRMPDNSIQSLGFYLSDGKLDYQYKADPNEFQINPTNSDYFNKLFHFDGYAPLTLFPIDAAKTAAAEDQKLEKVTDENFFGIPAVKAVWSSGDATRVAWFSKATQLPVRFSVFSKLDGQDTEVVRFDFTSFNFSPSFPGDLFTWSPPDDAAPEIGAHILKTGEYAADFEAVDIYSKPHRLSDLKENVKLAILFSSWDQGSAEAFAIASKLLRESGSALGVIAVDVWDDRSSYDLWMLNHKTSLGIPVYYDLGGRQPESSLAATGYGLSAVPTFVLLGEGDKVAAIQELEPDAVSNLEAALTKLGVKIAN
jgi:outer membrane lipoprotein-sorting protein